ncbi:spermidine synthase, partial [Bacillus cereus]
MPKHRKKNRMKIYRIQFQNKWYKREEDSELNSDAYKLDKQETEDTHDKQDKQGKQDKQDKQDKQ